MSFFETFLNAWKIAVTLYHNKQMEGFNNPTPEVVWDLGERRARCFRLKQWGIYRWGEKRIYRELRKLK